MNFKSAPLTGTGKKIKQCWVRNIDQTQERNKKGDPWAVRLLEWLMSSSFCLSFKGDRMQDLQIHVIHSALPDFVALADMTKYLTCQLHPHQIHSKCRQACIRKHHGYAFHTAFLLLLLTSCSPVAQPYGRQLTTHKPTATKFSFKGAMKAVAQHSKISAMIFWTNYS